MEIQKSGRYKKFLTNAKEPRFEKMDSLKSAINKVQEK